MRRMRGVFVVFLSAVSTPAWAGEFAPTLVPTLGEVGLIVLGVSLLGGGAVMLRRRRK